MTINRKLKILLVWPPKKNDFDIPEAPPLGLLYLAGVLREKHDVWVLDFNALKYSWKDIEERLKKEKPDLLGISATTLTYNAMVQIAKLSQKILPETKIMIGGPHVSAYPDNAKNDTGADYVLTGEGEESIWEIIDSFLNNSGKGEIIQGKRTMNLDGIPFPAIDLLEPALTLYQGNLPRYAQPETIMLWSRGCPFSCFFCSDVIYHGQKPRFRSPENIVAEIKRLKSMGIRSIFVYDDDLVGVSQRQFEWLERVCKLIIKEKLNDIIFKCQGRASGFVQLRTLKLMKKAGFNVIMWGCESGSDRVLKNLRKMTTTDDIRRTISLCKKAGIDAWMFLIVGNYTETKEDAEKTLQLVKELKPDYLQATYCTPYPSNYEKFAIKNDLIIEPDRSRWDTNEPVVRPDSMSLEDARYYRNKILEVAQSITKNNSLADEINGPGGAGNFRRYLGKTRFHYKHYGIKITAGKIIQKLTYEFTSFLPYKEKIRQMLESNRSGRYFYRIYSYHKNYGVKTTARKIIQVVKELFKKTSSQTENNLYREIWNIAAQTNAIDAICHKHTADDFEKIGEETVYNVILPVMPENPVVLDLGCGIGRIEKYLAPYCKELHAVDVSDEMLKKASKRLKDINNVFLSRVNGNSLKIFSEEKFDFVFSLLVLQHMEKEDAYLYLEEIHRVVKKGGSILLQFPNFLSDAYFNSFLADVRSPSPRIMNRVRPYTLPEIHKILNEIGFNILNINEETISVFSEDTEIMVLAKK